MFLCLFLIFLCKAALFTDHPSFPFPPSLDPIKYQFNQIINGKCILKMFPQKWLKANLNNEENIKNNYCASEKAFAGRGKLMMGKVYFLQCPMHTHLDHLIREWDVSLSWLNTLSLCLREKMNAFFTFWTSILNSSLKAKLKFHLKLSRRKSCWEFIFYLFITKGVVPYSGRWVGERDKSNFCRNLENVEILKIVFSFWQF